MEIRRPLKRAMPKLGPPDIYPQDPKQKEDELTPVNVKQGYTSAPLVSTPAALDEFGSAKNANIDAFGVFFSALLSEKHRINTLKDTQKKRQLVNTKEIWYVHAKTKHAVDNWFRDLANGTKSLGQLGKRIPIFNSKEGMFSQLFESQVPFTKAVWFIKMSAVHAIAMSESSSKSKKRQVPDQCQELTAALTKYLKEISIRMTEHFIPNAPSNDFVPTYNQWQYQTQLARYLFDEGLLDQYDFLCFLLELIEKKRVIEVFVKIICPLILEYVLDFSRSAVLSRRLAHVCARKLSQTMHHWPQSSKSTTGQVEVSSNPTISASETSSKVGGHSFKPNSSSSSSLKLQLSQSDKKFNQFESTVTDSLNPIRNANNNHLAVGSILEIVKAQIIETQNSFVENLTIDHDINESNLYKYVIAILSSIIQVLCIECPTAMVRHQIVDSKMPPWFQGSPLDHLNCLPSKLPMLDSDLNFELRKTIHDAEREILHRSAMADSKWSRDSATKCENSKAGLVNRLLNVLDILDKHNFDKIDSSNSIDILYSKIFIDNISDTPNAQDKSSTSESTGSLTAPGVLDLSSSTFNQSHSATDHSKKSKHQSRTTNPTSSNISNQTHDLTKDQPQNQLCNDPYETQVIKLLCEWATTTQRTGEHRALVVARLLEKRQSDIQARLIDSLKANQSKPHDTDDLKSQQITNGETRAEPKSSSNGTDQDPCDGIVHCAFQKLLVQFLDSNAPVIEESQEDNVDSKKAFKNLVLLFSELIRCDVFSHYNYMCTLISRGMFNDLSKGSNESDGLGVDSPAPNSNLNPGSVKQPKSVGSKESDSILSNTIQGLRGNTNLYPLSVSMDNKVQADHLDPLSGHKNVDQSLRSLGFSPVSSQQNVSQNMDKGHGLLDSHDDVDADLGKILQNIKEGQEDEAADILLPDYLGGGGSREDSGNKSQSMNKLPAFGLGDRSTLDNPISNTSSMIPTPANFNPSSVDIKPAKFQLDEKPKRSSSENRHMTFVKHFPVPDDENFMQDNNQRNILLYGFGKEREDAKHVMKKLTKDLNKIFGRKASRDINDGGKIKKLAILEGFNPDTTMQKFETLNQHDQHTVTNSISMTILEMFTGVSNGQTSSLPTLEALSLAYDLFSIAGNVSGLLELAIPILEELPDVEAQIRLKCPPLANQYAHSIALCTLGMLYRYHSCLLLSPKEELCSIFESLSKLVAHVPNPTLCTTSAERVIFCYLLDLHLADESCLIFKQYTNLIHKANLVEQSLKAGPPPSYTNFDVEWSSTILSNIVNQLRASHQYSNSSTNPILNASSGAPMLNNFSQLNVSDTAATIRQQLYLHDSPLIRQMNDSKALRCSFICDAIFHSATSTYADLVNDIAILCADVTSKCPALAHDLILALHSLCCSYRRDLGFRQLVKEIHISDLRVMDNITIFIAVLVARRCISLDTFMNNCAMPAILVPVTLVDRQQAEPGVRLTCHILLTLFRNLESPPGQSRYNQAWQSGSQNSFGQPFSNYPGSNSTPSYGSGILSAQVGGLLQPAVNKESENSKSPVYLKYLCDHHLLRSACCRLETKWHIALLKALRFVASKNSDLDGAKLKVENQFDDLSADGLGASKDLDDRTQAIFNLDSNFNVQYSNLQNASFNQYTDAMLRLFCSQRWLHDKCLSDSHIFTTTNLDNILIDPMLDMKQSQRLLYMICYNKSPEGNADVGLDNLGSDQVASIVKMFETLDMWSMRLSLMRLQFMYACKSRSNGGLNDWLDNVARAVVEFFQKASQENEAQEKEAEHSANGGASRRAKKANVRNAQSKSITDINKVWLIEPLLDKLAKPPSTIQSKIIKASASLMESASVRANSLPSLNQTYLSTAAASTKFKERTLSQRGSASTNPSNLASTSLLGFQPFLSLLMSCLKNPDKERETLLTSLNSQLYQAIHEKVDDINYKQSLQDGLELRLCLIGQMFDTIQKSSSLTSDWATLLLLLIMNTLVDPQIDYGLYVTVLDMLAMLIHSAYASDPLEQREESKKQYQNLVKKFRKELTALEDKGFIQLKLINPLMPLVRQMTEVIACEPMGSLVDTKGEKVENFYSIDKKKGLKVSEVHVVSPWELIEGHKNPTPLSWPWFGAVRMEQRPSRACETNRLMSWHTHNIRHKSSYFYQTDDGQPSAKRSNVERKPSQSNPLLKSLIEANDDSTTLLNKKENSPANNMTNDEESSRLDRHTEQLHNRQDILEDYCELPIEMLLDSTPVESMIEDIKSAMQAEHAAMSMRAKPAVVDAKPLVASSPASNILTPIQPESNSRLGMGPQQVSALSALQSQLNSTNPIDSPLLSGSGPPSVPAPMPISPMLNPRTPEIVPSRPHSTLAKMTPTPPPVVAPNRSMSPMVVARSPAITATPPPKAKPPRKKRVSKKDTNANAMIDANANIPANINKNASQVNMVSVGPQMGYANDVNTVNHVRPPVMVNQVKVVAGPNQMAMHSMHHHPQQMQPQQQQQHQPQQPQPGMIIRRGFMNQQQQPPQQQQQQQQQQASVYDFPYQPQQPQQSNQFISSGPMNNYYEPQGGPSGGMFQSQQQNQGQMNVQGQHQHPQQQQQHQVQMQQQQQQQQQQRQQHMQQQHHPIQYQSTGQHQQVQPRMGGHQHPHQQGMFQPMQHQQAQQQIFAPQQAAGHSRPALATMLHQKQHAAAGNMDNKMHPQRFNFG